MTILVTGATGPLGHHLLEDLADQRVAATAMVRVEAEAGGLPTGVEHVVATLEDPPPPSLLQEYDHVLLTSPATEQQADLEVTFVDALVAAGHRPHVVKVATDGFQDPQCQVRFMRSDRQVAKHLDALGLPVTYLAALTYMESLLGLADVMRDEALVPVPAGDGKVGFVATSDVARVAAHVLTHPGHEDRVYVVSGPEALGYQDVAERVSALFATTVEYVDTPAAQYADRLRSSGLPDWEVAGSLELFDWVRHGAQDSVTDEVERATGEAARPLTDWLRELRGAFLGRPADLPPPQL
jgi:NAD(P)H dehydrogenase (quinone)